MGPTPKTASENQYPEAGSGTVLALTIIAALLVVTVVIAGLIGVAVSYTHLTLPTTR